MSSFESLYNVLKDNKITSWIPTKLFKLGIFENVTFPEEIRYFEDRATTFKLFINCNKAVFSNYCGYFYNQVSSNSITRGNKENIKKLISLQSYLSCVKYEYSNHYTKAQCKQLICAAKEGYINTLLMVIGTFDYGNKDETKKLKFFKRQVSFIDLMKYNPPKKKNKKKKWVYILLNPFYVLIYKKWLSKHRK